MRKFNKAKKLVALSLSAVLLLGAVNLDANYFSKAEDGVEITEEATTELTEVSEEVTIDETEEVTEETTEEVTEEITEESTEETTEEVTEETTEEVTEETTEDDEIKDDDDEPDDVALVGWKIVDRIPIEFGGWYSYIFKVQNPNNPNQIVSALCADNSLHSPEKNMQSISEGGAVNENERKVLYHWFTMGIDNEPMKHHLALDMAKHGSTYGTEMQGFYNSCLASTSEKLFTKDEVEGSHFEPNDVGTTFTKTNGTYTYKTENIKFVGPKGLSVTITLANSETLHIVNGDRKGNSFKGGSSVKINAGEKFYIERTSTNSSITINMNNRISKIKYYIFDVFKYEGLQELHPFPRTGELSIPLAYSGEDTRTRVRIKKKTSDGNFELMYGSGNYFNSCSYEDVISGSYAYDLKSGTTFGIYTDPDCSSTHAAHLEDKDGNKISHIINTKSGSQYTDTFYINPGIYYVQEKKAPKGYILSNNVQTVIVGDDNNLTTFEFIDIPIGDPPSFEMSKRGLQGVKLAGAVFKLDYYKTVNPTGSPDLRWYFKTDNNGELTFDSAHLDNSYLDCSPLYMAAGGQKFFPGGTYQLTEIKAPEGYSLGGTYVVVDNNGNVETKTQKQIQITWKADFVANGNGWVEQLILGGKIIQGATPEIQIEETPIRVGFELFKSDFDSLVKDNAGAVPQGNATDLKATFKVVNNSGKAIWYDKNDNRKIDENETFANGATVFTFQTDSSGRYNRSLEEPNRAKALLQPGKYKIVETSAPNAYLNNGERLSIDIDLTNIADGNFLSLSRTQSTADYIMRGGFAIQKTDIDNKSAQGNATLNKTKFKVYNRSTHPVFIDTNGDLKGDQKIQVNGMFEIETDDNGMYYSLPTALPVGTYQIVEVAAPLGYLLSDTNGGVINQTIKITGHGDYWLLSSDDDKTSMKTKVNTDYATIITNYFPNKLTFKEDNVTAFKDAVIRGGFKLTKVDKERTDGKAYPGAKLDATFEVVNKSANAVLVDTNENGTYEADELFQPEEVCFTFKTDAETGYYESVANLLPYGTYEIKEKEASFGYVISTQVLTFKIVNNGEIVAVDVNNEELKILEAPIRVDMKLKKIDGVTKTAMESVPFKLSLVDKDGKVIESHIVFTDKDGIIDTSSTYALHTLNTNNGDKAKEWLDKYANAIETENADVIAAMDEEYKTLDYIKGGVGTWFGNIDVVDDTLGALVAGNYTIEELVCPVNKDMRLVSREFTIEIGSKENIDLGTLKNFPQSIKITTTATDKNTKEPLAKIGETVFVDEVLCEGLIPGEEYTVQGILMDKATNKPLPRTSADTNIVRNVINKVTGSENTYTSEVTFTAKDTTQTVIVEYPINTEDFQDNGEAKDIVIFEKLFYDNEEVGAEEDINNIGQTIKVPSAHTTAWGKRTHDNIELADEKVTLVDTVSYSNLIPNKTYVIKTVLMNKKTNKPLLDANKEKITGETEFTPDKPDGTVDVEVTFDASLLRGEEVVFFEDVRYEDISVAIHASIDDSDQTVKFPLVHTTASYKNNGSKRTDSAGPVVVVDKVRYEKLLEGRKYRLVATLMDKKTGKPVQYNGADSTATLEFTAKDSEGEIEMELTFNAPKVDSKTSFAYVVFEDLYLIDEEDGNVVLVGYHKDINSKGQTVYVDGTPSPRTGSLTALFVLVAMIIAACLIAAIVVGMRTNKKKI